MRVKIKDLKPNPYRDIKNYPIDKKKIESLTNSINQTGFWDNILARKNNGNIEIAYGHHRLVILKKLFKPGDWVDIPIKELDDPTMIRIMANENDESWGTGVQVLDETIRVTVKYLLSHPTKELILYNINSPNTRGPKPKYEIPSKIISKFLGSKMWSNLRVNASLRRLKLIDEGELDKEASELLPTEGAADKFVKATKQIKNTTPKQQKQAVKRIIETGDLSESGIKSALLDEKYKDMEPEKSEKEKEKIKARDFVHVIVKDLEKINEKIGELIKRKSEPNFDVYEDCIEAEEFRCEVEIFISNLKKLGGEK